MGCCRNGTIAGLCVAGFDQHIWSPAYMTVADLQRIFQSVLRGISIGLEASFAFMTLKKS
jgi:hypothetical protein